MSSKRMSLVKDQSLLIANDRILKVGPYFCEKTIRNLNKLTEVEVDSKIMKITRSPEKTPAAEILAPRKMQKLSIISTYLYFQVHICPSVLTWLLLTLSQSADFHLGKARQLGNRPLSSFCQNLGISKFAEIVTNFHISRFSISFMSISIDLTSSSSFSIGRFLLPKNYAGRKLSTFSSKVGNLKVI